MYPWFGTHLMPGAAHDGGEDGTGRVIAGEASLAHAGAIVHHQSSNIIVTHVGEICLWLNTQNNERCAHCDLRETDGPAVELQLVI
jgi:predicted TIM-barrel fold metal-dependent hydrolase